MLTKSTERAELAHEAEMLKPEFHGVSPKKAKLVVKHAATAPAKQMVGTEKCAVISGAPTKIHSSKPSGTAPHGHSDRDPGRNRVISNAVAFMIQVLPEVLERLFDSSGDVPLQGSKVFQRRRHGILVYQGEKVKGT